VAYLLGTRTGLSFSPHRRESVENGIRRAMARAGVTEPAHYRTLLETDGKTLDDLIVELTVGETYFFREPGQFEVIRRDLLPDLRRRRGDEHVLRGWSAGCASGEEAYSLAILFAEEGLCGLAHLLATDISRAALAKARSAAYSDWSLRGEGAAAARPYLHHRGDRYVLDDQVRRRVTFEYLNLALDVYPSLATGTWAMDLILCRNVLIYFDRQTIQSVARRLFESLAPGGWLLTASSDPPLAADAAYETVVTAAGVIYRRPDGVPIEQRPARMEDRGAFPLEPVTAWSQIAETEEPELPAEESLFAQTPALPPPPASVPPPTAIDPLTEAQAAFARGDYSAAVEQTGNLPGEAASVLRVRALANLDGALAERACAEAAARFPLSTELHYLHAVLLLDLGQHAEAARAARRVIYLDRSLAIAHFTLGAILRQHGDRKGARRAYRNARELCAARPPGEVVTLADGEHAGRLVEAATAELALLDAGQEAMP
jgi:chemotaxis protein methyltransferase CheR